jgi:protein-disulfide isomerase
MRDQSIGGSVLAMPVSPARDHTRGPRDAAVTLLEYGDYECPHCGRAHFIVEEIMAQDGDALRFAFRNFPLAQIHPHAQKAAEAAEAAGAQGRFWPMHAALFENQDALDEEDLVGYAQALELDLEKFQTELLRGNYAGRVREDFLTGVRSGVNGTPTFFINGRRHDGAWDFDSLMQAITLSASTKPRTDSEGRGQGRPHA